MPSDADKPTLSETVRDLAAKMVRFDPGELARLRRMDPDGPGNSDFWRLIVGNDIAANDKSLLLIRLMALLTPKGAPDQYKRLHDGLKPFGTVLGQSDYPETRVNQFLALPFALRGAALERMVRWIAAKGHDGVNCTDIALLLFSDDVRHARKLAESYYREKAKADAKEGKS